MCWKIDPDAHRILQDYGRFASTMTDATDVTLARVLRCEVRIVNTRLEPLIPVLVCMVVASAGVLHAKTSPDPRLRFLDPDLHALVQAGRYRSVTFRALVERLDDGDVIVYVQVAILPAGLHGQLTFLGAGAGRRYVMVRISRELDDTRKIAMLGHELQHAVEIMEQPQIVDPETLAREYGRFGTTRRYFANPRVAFDTAAAVVAGRQVSRELAARSGEAERLGTD